MTKPAAKRAPNKAPVKKLAKRPVPDERAKPVRLANTSTPASKLDLIAAALKSPKGASITKLMEITGWQMHSVRGALAGALKRKRGLKILSIKTDGERIYRIEGSK
jgi:hypothetical protein